MIEIKVPPVGESISEVTLVQWIKKDGSWVERDEVICELESEKATFELNAAERPAGAATPEAKAPEAAPAASASNAPTPTAAPTPVASDVKATPVANAMMADKKVDPASVKGSGSLGRILKSDVLSALENPGRTPGKPLFSREEKAVKMSNLRKTISTAMLTTFNEVDMGPIMDIRKQYKDKFKEVHGVNLGFMSFFTKACTIALQEWPAVNSYIDGDNIINHEFCDVSIAVSAPKGLVVPVIRNAESLSMAGIDQYILFKRNSG